MKTAISFITLTPNKYLIDFCYDILDKIDTDIYIFIDNNNFVLPDSKNLKLKFIKINNNDCIINGFQWVTFLMYNPNSLQVCSWDKALFYFSNINTDYDFIWGFEDDVFIPSINTLINLYNKYVNENNDLIVAKNEGNFDGNFTWLWRQAYNANLPLPWYCSMVPALGLSKRLIQIINNYAKKNGTLVLTEILFNTLAMHNNLNVIIAPELSTIVYKNNWTIEDIKNNKNNLFHPIKNFENHQLFRNILNNDPIG